MKQLSPLDSVFCLLEDANAPMHIGALLIFDQSELPNGFLRHKELLEYVQDRLHLSKGFRRKIVTPPAGIDYPYAVEDENFDLEFHVRHMGLPYPGDWRQLSILTARLISRPLDMSRPPWEMYIIERLDNIEGIPADSFAVVIKVHHAIVDGISAGEMMTALLQSDPNEASPAPQEPWIAERTPGPLELWARTAPNLLKQGWNTVSQGSKAVVASVKLNASMNQSKLKLPKVERTRFNDKLSPHRVFDAVEWPIAAIKELRQLVPKATLNDVIVSIIGGALRSYMDSINEPLDGSMVALCPISVRTDAAIKDGGNQVSGMRIAIGSDIEDPVERLASIQRATVQGKQSINADMATAMESWVAAIPPIYSNVAKAMADRFDLLVKMPQFINTLITNVPSPALNMDLYLAGAKMLRSYGIPPLTHGMGMGHVVGNSRGTINISVGADRVMMPDTACYIEMLQASYQQHRAALTAAADIQNISAEQGKTIDKIKTGNKQTA